ncbi:MAG TPA: type II toxin-antitoxin system VapC family toxin [Anaerolineae bacterium]|nr:type II toxin-antitoxin system VapC family toxin [Anaerolineae bacterium]
MDTNVISELIARQPNPQVVEWIDSLDSSSIYLSVITVGEIRKGIAKLADSKHKESLQRWLEEDLLIRFDEHILPLDVDVMVTWGRVVGELSAQGINLSIVDSLIGTTALHYRCILVTRNEADFRFTGVDLVNPWKSV